MEHQRHQGQKKKKKTRKDNYLGSNRGTRGIALIPLGTYRNHLYTVSDFAEILIYTLER